MFPENICFPIIARTISVESSPLLLRREVEPAVLVNNCQHKMGCNRPGVFEVIKFWDRLRVYCNFTELYKTGLEINERPDLK